MILAGVLSAAVMLDMALGDPSYRAHPVRLMGHLASGLESILRRLVGSGSRVLLFAGLVFAVLHPTLTVAIYFVIRSGLALVNPVAVYPWDVFIFTSCFAFRDLFRHVAPVTAALHSGDLVSARDAVQQIVGRDAKLLDSSGVARAAVESVAESLGDGAIGPLFWFCAGGVAGAALGLEDSSCAAIATGAALVYRAINTLDSMVGHKNTRYLYFGRVSARLDDLLSWLPARLAVVALTIAALILRLDVAGGFAAYRRDRHQHPSPNAGHPESFVAGALGVCLGGPTAYPYGTVDKAWLGDGRVEITTKDVRRCCRLVAWAGGVAAVATVGLLAVEPI